jgi:hypothetical protein
MTACPWCKAATSDPLVPCPHCGQRADHTADQPSAGGTTRARASSGAIAVNDVPELDLPRPRASKGGIARSAPITTASNDGVGSGEHEANAGKDDGGGLTASTGRTFDDGDFAGGSLELDLGSGPPLIADAPSGGRAKAAPAAGAKPSLGALKAQAAQAPVEPAQVTEAQIVPRILLDPFEARAVADYGEVPDAWWKTPLYAYRVLRRRPELKELADQKTQDAERAGRAAEEALLSFAEVVRYDAEKLGAYEEALQAVRVAEQVLGQRDAVLAAETDAHKHRQAESNAKLAELEAQLSRIQIEERQVGGELAEAGALLKRAEVHVKRIEAEMRAAIAQAEQGTPVGSMRGPGQ